MDQLEEHLQNIQLGLEDPQGMDAHHDPPLPQPPQPPPPHP